jgi:hypothetical protein
MRVSHAQRSWRRLNSQPIPKPVAIAAPTANGSGLAWIVEASWSAPAVADSGVACLALAVYWSRLLRAVSLTAAMRFLAWALTSVFSASASTVSSSSSRVWSISARICSGDFVSPA